MTKIIYKLWFNTTNWPAKGYSVSVQVNDITKYYLNFLNVNSWQALTIAPTKFSQFTYDTVEKVNDCYDVEKHLLLAEFKPRYRGFGNIPEWTCILDLVDGVPKLMFKDWYGNSDTVSYEMAPRPTSVSGGDFKNSKSNDYHFYRIDNIDPMKLA